MWLVMTMQEVETANKRMRRRSVRTIRFGPSECNNRRSQCENNPKGCRFGDRHDRGTATNALCLETEKFVYSGSSQK